MPEQFLDTEVIDHTRREINRLVSEIEQLAERDMPPSDFHLEFLRRTHAALAAEASALWMRNSQGHLQLACQFNLANTQVMTAEELRPGHDELLRFAVAQNRPVIVAPHASPLNDDSAGATNPTGYLIVLSPILIDNQPIGMLEIFQDASRRSNAHVGYLRFLARVSLEAAKFHKNRRFRQFVGQEKIWTELDAFIRSVHAGLSPRQTAYLIANDGRRLVGCERLSVAVQRGERVRIEAISGQDSVERKSNLIQRMARLTEAVLQHGETFVYLGAAEPTWPNDVRRALAAYLEESNSRLLFVIPLRDERKEQTPPKPPRAALVVEMIEDEAPPDELVGKVEVVSRHGALALYNALDNNQIFLLPLWKFLGKTTYWATGSRLPKTLTILGVVVVFLLAMFFLPWSLRLEGKGELLPKVRRTIYAPAAGIIDEVKVDRRSQVQPGAQLLHMSSPTLLQELYSSTADLEAKRQHRDSLRASKDDRRRQKADGDRDAKDLSELETQIEHAASKIFVVNQQLAALNLRAPISGQILDWNPKEKLDRRPVQQGETLLEIAEVAGEWIIEVQFPEKTVAHIARARLAAKEGMLPVSVKLSSNPESSYKGTLVELAMQASPVEKENVCMAKIRLDEPIPEQFRLARAEVRVKVDCGYYPVGYVLFREVIDFVRERVFF